MTDDPVINLAEQRALRSIEAKCREAAEHLERELSPAEWRALLKDEKAFEQACREKANLSEEEFRALGHVALRREIDAVLAEMGDEKS